MWNKVWCLITTTKNITYVQGCYGWSDWTRTFFSLICSGCNMNWHKLAAISLCVNPYLHDSMCPEIFLFDHVYGSLLRTQDTIMYEVSLLLGYDASLLGNWFPVLLDIKALKTRPICCLETWGINHPMTGISQHNGHFIYTTAKCHNLHDNLWLIK